MKTELTPEEINEVRKRLEEGANFPTETMEGLMIIDKRKATFLLSFLTKQDEPECFCSKNLGTTKPGKCLAGCYYAEQSQANDVGWISVNERPLITNINGNWICTDDGDTDFIGYVPTNLGGWIRHCVIEDGIGLCVVGDDDNEPAGWSVEDITHWMPLPKPPKELSKHDKQ